MSSTPALTHAARARLEAGRISSICYIGAAGVCVRTEAFCFGGGEHTPTPTLGARRPLKTPALNRGSLLSYPPPQPAATASLGLLLLLIPAKAWVARLMSQPSAPGKMQEQMPRDVAAAPILCRYLLSFCAKFLCIQALLRLC